MTETMRLRLKMASKLVAVVAFSSSAALSGYSSDSIDPTSMPMIGTIDKRFQAYNIEMVEVTGGRFWKSYKDIKAGAAAKKGYKRIRIDSRRHERGPLSVPSSD